MEELNSGRWSEFNNIVHCEELDLKEKGLLIILFRFINYKTGYADPSRTLLKKLTKIKKDETLDKILNSLLEKKVLIKFVQKGKRTQYKIQLPLKNGGTPIIGGTPKNGGILPPKIGGTVPPKNGGQKENKKKRKENNIYSPKIETIFNYWNSKNIVKHRTLTPVIKKAIEKALKSYEEKEIIEGINTYSQILNSKFYFNYIWNLNDFLNRKNGISTFLEDGTNRINYEKWKKKEINNGNTKGYIKRNRGRFTEGTENFKYKEQSTDITTFTDEEIRQAGLK